MAIDFLQLKKVLVALQEKLLDFQACIIANITLYGMLLKLSNMDIADVVLSLAQLHFFLTLLPSNIPTEFDWLPTVTACSFNCSVILDLLFPMRLYANFVFQLARAAYLNINLTSYCGKDRL